VPRRSLAAKQATPASGLKTGKLTTGKLTTGKLSPAKAEAKEAEKELTTRTKGARLVGMVGDDKFRVTLTPVKKRKEKKDQPDPPPLRQWSSSSFAWPDDPAADLEIPGVPWRRRICGITATVTNVQAPGTALVLEILPGADDAVLFRMGTSTGVNATGDLVYQLHAFPIPSAAASFFGADACSAPLPADLWIDDSDRVRLRWSDPIPLAMGTIVGVVIRFENSLAA